jgi:hypothetical protein
MKGLREIVSPFLCPTAGLCLFSLGNSLGFALHCNDLLRKFWTAFEAFRTNEAFKQTTMPQHYNPEFLLGKSIMRPEIAPDVIEKCLNHTKENKVKWTYQRQNMRLEQTQA